MYVFLGIYTFFLVIIWGFFIVAKMHAYQFKHFGEHIVRNTNLLLISLVVFSLAGYILIFYMHSGSNTSIVDFKNSDFYFNEINY